MRRWPSSRIVVVGAAIVVFVACSLLPVSYLVATSIGGLDDLRVMALEPRQRQLLINTAALGTGTALLATAIGAPLGIALARIPLPRKGAVRLALAAPVLLPPYIVGLAWTYLGSRSGRLAALVGEDVLFAWTYSMPAAVLVLALVLYPLAMLATEVAARRIDGRLEEAALIVAGPSRVLWRITVPLAFPAIVGAALVVFVLAISEFGVPALLRVPVYTTEVFTAFAAFYDFSRATLLSIPLMGLCVVIAAVAVRLLGAPVVVTRRGVSGATALPGRWRAPATMFTWAVIVVALIVPLAVLVSEAMGARSIAAAIRGSGGAVVASVLLATAGATLVVVVAVWLGYARARAGVRTGHGLDVLFVAAFAVPSTVVGIALIGLWNRPGWLGELYGTHAMLILGYLARFVPVAALVVAASARYVATSHEEAAAVGGAGWIRTMAKIVLPQMRLGVAAAWVIVFVMAFGELGVSILVAPPGESTLPIRIYTLIANTPASHVAALALLQSAVVLLPLAVLAAVASQRDAQ
jgi:iron(III) transport system permease protein